MSLKRGILYTFLAQLPTLLFYFISSTMMTRALGDEGRGIQSLFNNQIVLFQLVLGLNLQLGITYFINKKEYPREEVIDAGAGLLIFNALSLAILLGAIAVSDTLRGIFMPNTAASAPYFLYVFGSVIIGLYSSSINAVFQGLKEFRLLNQLGIFNALLSAITFTAVYFAVPEGGGMKNIPLVLGCLFGMLVLMAGTLTVLYIRRVGLPVRPVLWGGMLARMIRFTLPGHLANVLNMVNYRFDVWVVEYYCGTVELGLYAVATGLAQLLFHVPEPFSRVLQPYLYGSEGHAMVDRFKAIARLNFSAVLIGAAGLAVCAYPFIPMLYGEAFTGSVTPLVLLLPGIVFASATKLYSILLAQQDSLRAYLLATATGACVTIGMDLLLIPIWGIAGAAVASTLAYFTTFFIICIIVQTRLGIPLHDAFLLRPKDIALLKRP